MKPYSLLPFVLLLAACQDSIETPRQTSGVRESASVNIPNDRVKGTTMALAYHNAEKEALKGVEQQSWREADRDFQAYLQEHAADAWIEHVRYFGSHKMLYHHFSGETLTAEQAAVASRYADVLLSYEEAQSTALNHTLVALRPHWSPERFERAVSRVSLNAQRAPCPGCGPGSPMPPSQQREAEASFQEGIAALEAAAR